MKDRYWWRWYRKYKGGSWYLIHLAPDMPLIRLFCIWTQCSPDEFEGIVVIDEEHYPLKNNKE